jgi:alpha-mannosidase
MNFRQLTVLLPCHSLEDFPVYHEGEAADELLVAWCAPWHPELIAAAGCLPAWQRVDIPPENLLETLAFIPPFCLDRLPLGYAAKAVESDGRLVAESTLQAATRRALEVLERHSEIEAELVTDFHALGFCRLQIELLTRQMRYTVSLDEAHFTEQALAATQAACSGQAAEARKHLERCFDVLYDARKHFYPVDVYLLDMTLLAETTLGETLAAEIDGRSQLNLLGSGDVLETLAVEHPDSWRKLLDAVNYGKACVLGGDDVESPLPLLPVERLLDHLRGGVLKYEALLGRPPYVYGRRRAGLTPVMPQLLAKLGYQGALHFTLDDGAFPLGPQSKVRWEGLETSVIDVYARVPAEAAKPETFLALSRLLSDSMDTDHVATVAFAHWPSHASPWYQILRRIAELSPVLGKFALLDDYFMHTDMPGRLSKFTADDYRTPYLKQAIIRRHADPISMYVAEHERAANQRATGAIDTVARLLGGAENNAADGAVPLAELSRLIPRTGDENRARYLVFNPGVGTRRMGVDVSELPALPVVSGPVVAAAATGDRKFAVVDVPSVGFVWLEAGVAASSGREKSIVAENALRNEFLEVRISQPTGGIQGLYNFAKRGNQLSQQLAFRMGATGGEVSYSTMRADTVETTVDSSVYGELTSRGGLYHGEQLLARFEQRVGLWAGSRTVDVEIALSEVEEPRADPWNSYLAARFAWPDEGATLYRGIAGARQETTARRFEAPEFVDIESGANTVSLLTGGLPYHRRSESRMLDSLLVVRGESRRKFRFGLGVDLPHPAANAMELVEPRLLHVEHSPAPATASGWFFHLGAKNVVATHWEPLLDSASNTTGGVADSLKGFRVRLLEIAGNAGRVPLRAFRSIAYARQVDFVGETILELYVDDDKIMLDFGPYELLEVEAHWIR